MLQPILKVEDQTDTSNGYFYDHLHNQIYLVKEGQLLKRNVKNLEDSVNVSVKIHEYLNNQKIFPSLVKIKGDCRFNLQKTSFTSESDAECTVRTDVEIKDGTSWSWYVPESLKNVKLGVVQITKTNNAFQTYVDLVASTSRTVTFIWSNGQLKTWVNGHEPSRDHVKKIAIEPTREPKFYPVASCTVSGQTLIFNPFATVPKLPLKQKFTKSEEKTVFPGSKLAGQKLKKIVHLTQDKFLLVSQNEWIKLVHRNSATNRFDLPSIEISAQGLISGLFNQSEFTVLINDDLIKDIWANVSTSHSNQSINELKSLIERSLNIIEKEGAKNRTSAYRILVEKMCILRSLHSDFNLANSVYESEFDRSHFSQTSNKQYFGLPESPQNNIPKSVILNQEGWTKVDGKISEITQNYLLSIDEETVLIYHIGDRVKEVFKQNIVFFEFNKTNFLERYNETDLRTFKKGEKSSSIYKLLANCFSKEKKQITEFFPVKENDLKELINDYRISEADAKLSLEQTGSVEQALTWLSRPQNQRVYIPKPEQSKNKGNEQSIVSGSLLELSNPSLIKLLLKVNNQLYLLGYDPKNLNNNITKGEKVFVNLFDFKRQSNIEDLDQSSWFNSQNHQPLTILDGATLKEKGDFLVKDNGKIFVVRNQQATILKASIEIDSKVLFENEASLKVGNFENFDCDNLTRDISGEVFYNPKIQQAGRKTSGHTFVHNGQVFSDLSSNTTQVVQIQAKISGNILSVPDLLPSSSQEFIPLLIERGPPSCNLHYSISQIINPGSTFLANYPDNIVFRNNHSKFMKVNSVVIERENKKLTVNYIKEGNVWFESESGVQSQKYQFEFKDGQTKVQVPINQKGYWKYIVLSPFFSNGKKMPYQIGFFGAKGQLIENQTYKELLFQAVSQSLTIYNVKTPQISVPFEVIDVLELGNQIVKVQLNPNGGFTSNYGVNTKSIQNILNVTTKRIFKPELSKQEEDEQELLKGIDKKDSNIVLKSFENANFQVPIIKQIVKNSHFTFGNWKSEEIRKFIDLTSTKADNLKPEVFKSLFDKIYATQQGKKYLNELWNDIGKCFYSFPQNHVTYMMKKITPVQLKTILQDLLTQLPKYRSFEYNELRKNKIPYLLLEENFFSRYYLSQIEAQQGISASTATEKSPVFEEQQFIPAQFVVIRDESSRKIYSKLSSSANVTSIVLRFDRSETLSRINFKIFSLATSQKTLLSKGTIAQHEWAQVSRNSQKENVKEFFGNSSTQLNAYAINIDTPQKTDLLEIQLLYNQTGLITKQNDGKNTPFIDIVPEIYGEKSGSSKESKNRSPVMRYFDIKQEEGFYLSSVDIGLVAVEKFSVSKENESEYTYFKPAGEKVDVLRRSIQEKIEKKDYIGAIPDHKKLVSTYKQHSNKTNLDYVYTLLMLTLEQIFTNKVALDETISQRLFDQIIVKESGPIRISAFKAVSSCVNYLIKSLPFIEEEGYLPNLERTSFQQKELENVLDPKNVPLCNSLNKLVIKSIPYNDEWAKFLIKINLITQKFEDNILYIINSKKQWFKVQEVLAFFDSIPENYFSNVLLANVDGESLEKYILQAKKNNKTSRIHLLIDKLIQIYKGKIDLDIVSMMLEEKDIKWHNLYKIIKMCPQAEDSILTHFLQIGHQSPAKLAESYPQILNQCAKSAKHSQNLAEFFKILFEQNRTVFKKAILSLSDDIVSLHSDMLEVLAAYLYQECNFGGIEGAKLLKENELFDILVAQILLKKIDLSQLDEAEFKEINQQDILIEWYFCNNSYELVSSNPANKSPGILLMKALSQRVLQLIQSRSIDKILKVFDRLITQIQVESLPLSTKHLYINQINEGVSQLLGKCINPESLTKILVNGENDMLRRIFESLAKLNSRSSLANPDLAWTNTKEIEYIEKFTSVTSIKEKVKDWEANRNGSKNVLFKVPFGEKKILLKSADPEGHVLSKIAIGFNAVDNQEKNNVFPSEIQLFGGQNENNLVKICELKEIRDQHFESFNTRVYGVNFNSIPYRKCSIPIQTLELRITEPLMTSMSDLFENNQKNKKQAFYSVSFLSLLGYESQPKVQPSYNQIYMTLLSFLTEEKYSETLKHVVQSAYYKQKSSEILRLLNSLLPDSKIESLLLALNNQNQNVLESVFDSSRPNIKLVQSLMEANPSAENIKKLLSYFVKNQNQKLTEIIVSSIKLFSYEKLNEKIDLNVEDMVKLYESSGFKGSVFSILATVLATPSAFNFNYEKLVESIWSNQSTRSQFYKLIGSTIAHYPQILSQFLRSGKTAQLTQQLITLLQERTSSVHNEIYLLSQLSIHQENRQFLIQIDAPIKIVNLLRDDETLINKSYGQSMKYFILLFQSTCIQSLCEERFSEILIDMMVKLPDVAAAHHNFFIHQFFFPLINAFKGIPVKFVWKNSANKFLYQATHSLKTRPIKSNSNTIIIDGLYLETTEIKDWSSITEKSKYRVLNKINQIVKDPSTVDLSSAESQHKVYRVVNEETENLLTNQTLYKLKNLGIFGSSYLNEVPVQDATFEKVYYLPCEMTLSDVLKQVNLCGYKLNEESIKATQFFELNLKTELNKESSLEQILPEDKRHFAILQLNPQQLFSHTTIAEISKNATVSHVFIPQQTIFKAFERKEGLMKMIRVLKTCVKNWNNSHQSKIWEQYLNELESYSCFPVFSSIYMNKQDNVQLLFDILSGLPDKEDAKKWIDLEKSSVKFLYSIIKDVFQVEGAKALEIRKYAVEHAFYKTMLERLHIVSKQPKRTKVEDIIEEEQQLSVPTNIKKINSEDDYKLKVVKKKGIGYGNDSSSNQKWDITGQQESRKEVSNQILDLLKILEKFLDHKMFEPTKEIVEQSFESALLPILESSLRGGSLLEISKSAELFKGQLSFIKALTKKKALVPILMSIPKNYEPKQHQSILELLKVLESTSRIFLSCLTGSVGEKLSEEIAKGIIETYELVEQSVSNYQLDHVDQDEERKILELPLAKKYPLLLKDLRFDYIDMKDKNGKISKHHYSSNFAPNHKNPPAKTIRLAQELADISHALPVQHTNAIYVRCDKERVDFMQALIMGSNGTPYGHGAYLFDIYFDDSYPNNPPKVNLTTTGNGQIRFNPNLYSCGKVCLSLLGTWRGSAMENWDPKVSTLLQILVSIQSIIMSEEVYFNEPGFEHEQGTIEGQKKNEAYANIVRYGNIKFAMIENIKNPPKGFEHIIKRHFYLKKDEILEQTKKWLKYAEKREASYNGLVSDHNNNWSNTFKKSKTEYKTMLEKAIKQLEEELNKLPEPSNKDLKTFSSPKKEKKKHVKIESKDQNIEQVDVTYDKTDVNNLKQLDINDEKVKDRWSRYIGAMGLEAVSKQSKANILLFGLGATGVEIAKNIILSGCKRISIVDQSKVQITDLSGQFFLSEEDLGSNRVEACLYKLQELNHYVRVEGLEFSNDNLEVLKQYDVVIMTEQPLQRQKLINAYCHENGIKFIITDCYGPFGQHFNDFGTDFEVLDKNGEDTVEVMIENITNAEKGVVTLLNKQRHPYEDGEAVRITGVKGMTKENGQSINGTIHKIRVINQYSFQIGNTTEYSAYEVDGLARNMKLPIKVEFKSLEQSLKLCNIDGNLSFYDFEKSTKNAILHKCFVALSNYREKYEKYPLPWNWADGEVFVSMVKELYTEELKPAEVNFIRTFAYTCTGTFAPLAAFFGGLTAQQAFKAITGKYMPINQYFFTEFSEVVPSLPQTDAQVETLLKQLNYTESKESRGEGIRRILGKELTELVQKCRVFLIGSGAIGCELLKNYAMINLATSKDGGEIIVTDPDHIEESNLNRQFLFRQKHLRKPKSVTAAAAVSQMNKLLKGKIRAKLDRVCETTKDTFSNEFFESLNIVTNALDNVKARQYVDQRCVENKVALLESGTLSSKGHVQVIIPYQTETYGSKNDPAEEGEIPHCTLKMFPEETLHCVEWARDIFGKTFTLDPKALGKLVQKWKDYTPTSSDLQMLKSCLKMLQKKPVNFEEAVLFATNKFYELYRNDIKQLLYTYPLDAKTKDGKPFWKLPKRPPTPIEEIDPENELHGTFITSYAVMLCKVFNVEYPKDFRKEERRKQVAKEAAKIKVEPFVPNDKLAKQMAEQVNKNEGGEQKAQETSENVENEVIDENGVFDHIKKLLEENKAQVKVNAEQFQKDDDQNGHIDIIYSMANLRAWNYKLQPMDWMTTKLKAGRITPALSTTTSCVAALQTIELIKYLKKCKLDKMRNTFINLAVPMIQAGEPGEVEKIKIHENLTTNIWERWEIGPFDLDKVTVGELLTAIEEKYKINVKILSILEGAQIYSDLVLGLQSKKDEKEEYLKKSLREILLSEVSAEELKKFIDLTLVFAINEELAKHVPTIRLKFNE